MLQLAVIEPSLSSEARDWRRERRSAWLRVVAFAILVVNLLAHSIGETVLAHTHLVQSHIVVGYGSVTLVALALALSSKGPRWMASVLVAADATTVVALFHQHLLTPGGNFDHSLTAPTLAIGFLLLAQVSLRLEPRLVRLFAALVLTGWLVFLGVAIVVSVAAGTTPREDIALFVAEAALASTFGFSAYVCFLSTRDHNTLLRGAVASERRRGSLARFFSPAVAAEIEAKGTSLALSRRTSTILFVDLRSFTRLSETVSPEDLAALLVEYRQLVTDAVFAEGGIVDKFIGDAVMAVFGHPHPAPDDSYRALHCARRMAATLDLWRLRREAEKKPALAAGIGIHSGVVMGGVVRSGRHDEFTVLGDVVNIAQRLEGLTRQYDAAVVASEDVFAGAAAFGPQGAWVWMDAVELRGRQGRLRIAVLPRTALGGPV